MTKPNNKGATKMATQKKAVVVTTEHRAMFFGYLKSESDGGRVVVLEKARLCLKWDAAVKGFMGLAATGPIGSESRVGPQVPLIKLQKVTAMMDASAAAAKQWEAAPW